MLCYGLTADDLHRLVDAIAPSYAFNLRAVTGHSWMTRNGPRCRFVLRAKDSHYEPARRAASGRRTVAVSWKCHADVLDYLFQHGATRIVTRLADYRRDTFWKQYPDTYYTNVGSQLYPAYIGEL